MRKHGIAVSAVVYLAALSATAQSSSKNSFDLMKSLTGNWEGKTTWEASRFPTS
jgi:hypothetical protein